MAYKRINIIESSGHTCEYLAPYAPLWWQKQGLQYTRSGYGPKIPTEYIVYYKGRDRRIYVSIYSNIGTAYILCKGERLIVQDI